MSRAIWIPDRAATKCYGCGAVFSFWTRKHHCRACGRIFCAECTSVRVTIPSFIGSTMSPDVGFVDKTLRWWNNNGHQPQAGEAKRCCASCHRSVLSMQASKTIIHAVILLGNWGINIYDWRAMACVCKSWKQATDNLLHMWDSIRHTMPYTKLTQAQRSILESNRACIGNHTLWNIVAVWQNIIPVYRTPPAMPSCQSVVCHTRCSRVPAVMLHLTSFLAGNTSAGNLVASALARDPQTLTNVVPWAHTIAASAVKNETVLTGLIIPLFRMGGPMFELCHAIYFAVRCRNAHMAQALFDLSPGDWKATWSRTERWIAAMRAAAKGTPRHDAADYRGACLPSDPETFVEEILFEAVSAKSSATRPVVIPCMCRRGDDRREFVQCFLFKSENVYKDAAVMSMLEVYTQTCKIEEVTAVCTVTYDVMPLSPEDGLIGLVQGVRSLYSLWQEKISIQNYVMENNLYTTINTLRLRFIGSSAAAVVMSFLVGAGDRHLDNILVCRDGRLFGCDFSYLMGQEPIGKRIIGNSVMRIVPSMIDFMGGLQSQHYQLFRSVCSKLYNHCRQWLPWFYLIMYSLVLDGGVDPLSLQSIVETAWCPGNMDKEAAIEIEERIERQSRGETAWMNNVADMLHHLWRGKDSE